jgi:small subunit ribosomal protein S8
MIYNVLSRINNGLTRKMSRVKVPYSTADMAVLDALVKHGYITSAVRKGRGVKRIIDIDLKYDEEGQSAINGIKLISKPSRRIYAGYREIKPSRRGHGRFILSTPSGIRSNHDARREKVGGEILFEIW